MGGSKVSPTPEFFLLAIPDDLQKLSIQGSFALKTPQAPHSEQATGQMMH